MEEVRGERFVCGQSKWPQVGRLLIRDRDEVFKALVSQQPMQIVLTVIQDDNRYVAPKRAQRRQIEMVWVHVTNVERINILNVMRLRLHNGEVVPGALKGPV